MFPLIAISALGAIFVGASVAHAAGGSEKSSESRRQKNAEPRDVASPQSFIITPLDRGQSVQSPQSIVESIGKFIV